MALLRWHLELGLSSWWVTRPQEASDFILSFGEALELGGRRIRIGVLAWQRGSSQGTVPVTELHLCWERWMEMSRGGKHLRTGPGGGENLELG